MLVVKLHQVALVKPGSAAFSCFTDRSSRVERGHASMWKPFPGNLLLLLVWQLMSTDTLGRGLAIVRSSTMSLENDPLYLAMLAEKEKLLAPRQEMNICKLLNVKVSLWLLNAPKRVHVYHPPSEGTNWKCGLVTLFTCNDFVYLLFSVWWLQAVQGNVSNNQCPTVKNVNLLCAYVNRSLLGKQTPVAFLN